MLRFTVSKNRPINAILSHNPAGFLSPEDVDLLGEKTRWITALGGGLRSLFSAVCTSLTEHHFPSSFAVELQKLDMTAFIRINIDVIIARQQTNNQCFVFINQWEKSIWYVFID